MSPVSTAMRSVRGRVSSVFSSRLVLPDPGALIRFRQRVPCSRKRSRRSPAIRSFSLRIFFSSGTRLMFLHLQVNQLQLVSADAFRALVTALRASKLVTDHVEFRVTSETTLPPWAKFNFQFQSFNIGVPSQDLESEPQRIGIYRCQFADS